MELRKILVSAAGAGMTIGLLAGTTMPVEMLPLPQPSWRQLPHSNVPPAPSLALMDASSPMEMTVPDGWRPDDLAQDAFSRLQRDHVEAARAAYLSSAQMAKEAMRLEPGLAAQANVREADAAPEADRLDESAGPLPQDEAGMDMAAGDGAGDS